MEKPKRPVLGVIAAEANSIEQRQILRGIIEQAQAYGYNTAIISNIFNQHLEKEDISLGCENRIYELINSDEFSAFIVIPEAFQEESLKRQIADLLRNRDVPVICTGQYIEEFDLSPSCYINTSDENDIEEAVSHLIEAHGFRDIDILTGPKHVENSLKRTNGYRAALKKHGIEVDEKKIHYGDYWMNSGKDLVDKYASGLLPMPQALVCANDYMAYGVLDAFVEKNISVPDQISVIGYEYVGHRTLHTPLLTTYQRNREELGRTAVRMIRSRLGDSENSVFSPPRGWLVTGSSCPCSLNRAEYYKELSTEKSKADYEFWHLFSPLDQKLTESQNLNEYISILGSYHWLIRSASNIFLCLYSNWYESNPQPSDIIICRSIMPWLDNTPFNISRFSFSEIFNLDSDPVSYYFAPLFFGNKLLGHMIIRYDSPDCYDDIFRNWIKSVSNSLEFLRMKNDIQYLTRCQNLSETRDTLTGMYNEIGIEKAYQTAVPHGNKELYFVLLKVCLFDETVSSIAADTRVAAIIDASKAVSKFCGNHDISARISENTFVCIVQSNAGSEVISDCLSAILSQHRKYMEIFGMDTFVCVTEKCGGSSYKDVLAKCTAEAEKKYHEISEKRVISHFKEMSDMRNFVYIDPAATFDTENLHVRFSGSVGYFRSVYKQCFGISFHKDCINARIAKAKYYLSTTTISVIEISEKCGYFDSKYFLRQFNATVGITPIQYRSLFNG